MSLDGFCRKSLRKQGEQPEFGMLEPRTWTRNTTVRNQPQENHIDESVHSFKSVASSRKSVSMSVCSRKSVNTINSMRIEAEVKAMEEDARLEAEFEAARLKRQMEEARSEAEAEAKRLEREAEAEEKRLKRQMEAARSEAEAEAKRLEIQRAIIKRKLDLEMSRIDEEAENILEENSENQSQTSRGDRAEAGIVGAEEVSTNKKLEDLQKWFKNSEIPVVSKESCIPDFQEPTKLQMLARKTIGRDLPPFSGLLEEWGAFIFQFRQSNSMCGFSDAENLYRLQRSLRGKARETVNAMLVTPGNVTKIIEILEKRFGRPENIIQSMMKQVKNVSGLKEDKPTTIVEFGTFVQNLVVTIENLNRKEYLLNPQLLAEMVQKLSPTLRMNWGIHRQTEGFTYVSIRHFADWLENVASAAQTIEEFENSSCEKRYGEKRNENHRYRKETVCTIEDRKPVSKNCHFCNKSGHFLRNCKNFVKLHLDARWKWVKEGRRCFCCLETGHGIPQCTRKIECGLNDCDRFHHQLLHCDKLKKSITESEEKSEAICNAVHSILFNTNEVLLGVLPVVLKGPAGEVKTFALTDDGSTATIIEESLADELGLTGPNEVMRLKGLSPNSMKFPESRKTTLQIQGIENKEKFKLNARTVKNIELPSQSVNFKSLCDTFPYLKKVKLSSQENVTPRILIGSDNIHLIVSRDLIEGREDEPLLSKTKLGWIVKGNTVKYRQKVRKEYTFLLSKQMDEELHQLVKESFKTETFGVAEPKRKLKSKDEERADEILENETRRVGVRWETALIWKCDDIHFPDSKIMALNRLKTVERKMDRDQSYGKLYCDKIQEYISKDYARMVIKEEMDREIDEIIFWSDSSNLLSWIRSDARRYKQFVAFRIGEILESTEVYNWRWLPTEENVADEGTRFDAKVCFDASSRWLNGPAFLVKSDDYWPKERKNSTDFQDCELELKVDFVAVTQEKKLDYLPDVTRFSKYNRLLHATARLLKCIRFWKERNKTNDVTLVADLKSAEVLLIRRSQLECYEEEIKLLQQSKSIAKSSKLFKLSPMLDENGLLRINGRIRRAGVSTDVKCPIILDRKNQLTILIMEDMHVKAGHVGFDFIMNEIRQKFYISKMNSAVRKIGRNCFVCKLSKAKPQSPMMGDLPACRLQSDVRAFTHTAMDYFGPFSVTVGRRHEKRYVVLFTCLTTRAIHLEIANSLTTDSAIQAIRRMIARRGYPLRIYSDNGTNLRGADAEMKKALQDLNQETLTKEMSLRNIEWFFIPPAAPHMGGSWERLVRSVKTALHSVLKERSPKDETLSTLFVEAESIVNVKCKILLQEIWRSGIDWDDTLPQEINHNQKWLIWIFTNDDLCLRKQWRIAQHFADMFWKRWIREYLPNLTRRSKWHEDIQAVKVSDLVIIADNTLPRSSWPKGLVVATFPGKDGRVRVADVKTASGIYRRPVTKLCVVDITKKDNEPLSVIGGKNVATGTNKSGCSDETNKEG